MECVIVKSKLIASVAYYRDTQKLRVWFHNGRSTTHENITSEVFQNLVSAESPGFYYQYYIATRRKSRATRPGNVRKLAAAIAVAVAMLGASSFSTDHTQKHVQVAASRK